MATVKGKSGTFNISTSNSAISGYVEWQETYDDSTYASTNKSKITLTAYLHRTNIYSGETYFYSGTVTRTAFFDSETVGSTVVTDMSIPGNTSSSGGTYVQVYTASKEITHDSDGSKSITLGFSMSNNISGVAGQSFTVPKTTATVSLTTIPRATTPSLSATSVTMGNTINITLSPADSTFTHKIRYEFGSLASQINGIRVNGSQVLATQYLTSGTYTFTPPTSLGSQIPSANSGTAKLIVYTYRSDGTHIGTKTVDVTINVPSYTPTINCGLIGNNLLSGEYVQNKSTVTATIAAVSSYGATIKSYSSVVDGKTYTGQQFTSSVLSSGSKTVVVTVTDSRNKTATYTSGAFTVYAYSAPSITEFTFERQSDETTVIATVKGSVASVNSQNAKTVTITLNGNTETITASSYTISETATFTDVPTDSTLTGTAIITDSYTSATREAVLPTVSVTMDFYKDGKGVAFGKVAENSKLLDVAWGAKVKNIQFQRGTRPTSANIALEKENYGSIEMFLASSAMTDGKAMTVDGQTASTHDGYITHFHWDNSGGYDAQLFLKNKNGSLLARGCDAGTWGAWKQFLDNSMCKDYVIEQGTTGGWEYTKWNNGKIELFGEKSLSFPALTQQTDYLWRSIVSLDLSSYLTKIISGTCAIQTNGMVPQVCRNGTTPTTAEIVIATSRSASAFTITAPVYIIGKWK